MCLMARHPGNKRNAPVPIAPHPPKHIGIDLALTETSGLFVFGLSPIPLGAISRFGRTDLCRFHFVYPHASRSGGTILPRWLMSIVGLLGMGTRMIRALLIASAVLAAEGTAAADPVTHRARHG